MSRNQNIPSFDLGLNAVGAFQGGQSIANQIIENRLRGQQMSQNYDIQNRQMMLQEQEMQQKQAFQRIAQEAFEKPEIVLPQLYAKDPVAAARISEGVQQRYSDQYNTLNLLTKETKAENKQATYDLLKPKLQQLFPNLEFGDRVSTDLMNSLKTEASAIKAKMKMNLDFRDTAQGVVGFNPQTGEGIATGFNSRATGDMASPASVREYQYFNNLSPADKASYLNLKRNTVGEGMTIDQNGQVIPLANYIPNKSDIEQAKSAAKKEGELGTEKKFDQPKVQSAMESSFAKNDNVIKLIDKSIPKVDSFTAGFAGSSLSKIPGSDARDLQKQLKTIVANLGFDELQEMRKNSPTGGALGQVAIQEIEFLQSVKANLEQDQSPAQLRENLESAKNQIISSKNRIRAAYDREYQKPSDSGIKFLGFE